MSDAFSDWYEAKLAEARFAEEWTPCVKLPITVHFRKQRPGEKHVSTREGITPLNPDDLIMRGVAGEEYPIGRELFERTYRIGTAPPDSAARIAELEAQRDALRRLIADDAHAMTFQTLGQYRSALLAAIKEAQRG